VPEGKGQPAVAVVLDTQTKEPVVLSRRSFFRATGEGAGAGATAPPPPPNARVLATLAWGAAAQPAARGAHGAAAAAAA
jgi:hypothetical protein